jgi:D-3-phosphoglycerate dehydrogenase
VNTFSLTAKEYQSVKPFLKLSSLLGGFAGQLTENAIKSIQIEFEGTAANVNSVPLTQTIIYSLLKPTTDSINIINSVLVAKSKSISISEVKHQKENDYQSLIKLTVVTDKQSRSVSGTIFGGRARIVEIKGIKIEADLSEHNLYVTNQDKPGFVKDLSKILADNKINIATFHLGRLSSGGEAIAIISTDNKIENSVIEGIKKIPLVIQAKYIQFKDKEYE